MKKPHLLSIASSRSSSISKSIMYSSKARRPLTWFHRQNPAVTIAANDVFRYIVLALGAETLQGATAQRVATSVRQLAQAAGVDAKGILETLSPETQQTVRAYFA